VVHVSFRQMLRKPLFREQTLNEKERLQFEDNKRQGKRGENQFRFDEHLKGHKVERTGKGSDFKVTLRDLFTGEKKSEKVEVKTGNAKPSKLQEQTGARVVRVKPIVY